jgi:hypothetical protein
VAACTEEHILMEGATLVQGGAHIDDIFDEDKEIPVVSADQSTKSL